MTLAKHLEANGWHPARIARLARNLVSFDGTRIYVSRSWDDGIIPGFVPVADRWHGSETDGYWTHLYVKEG